MSIGPCGLGNKCHSPHLQLRNMYKCVYCHIQLHQTVSGCSKVYNNDDSKVQCISDKDCLERNPVSGRPIEKESENSSVSVGQENGYLVSKNRQVVIKGTKVNLSEQQSNILDVYENSVLMSRNNDVVREVRIAVRNYVWGSTKFVKGEGSMKRGQLIGNKRIKLAPEFGNSHERPDFTTQKPGYQTKILQHCNYGVNQRSSVERALFWKTYEDVVKSEIQLKRSAAGRQIKMTLQDGECRERLFL